MVIFYLILIDVGLERNLKSQDKGEEKTNGK